MIKVRICNSLIVFKIIAALFLLFQCLKGNSQDTTKFLNKSISFYLGTNYNDPFSPKAFPIYNTHAASGAPQMSVSGTRKVLPGFHFAYTISSELSKSLHVEQGISFFSQREKKLRNTDPTERAYVNAFNISHGYPLDTIIENAHTTKCLSFPFFVGGSYKRFGAELGFISTLVWINRNKVTYLSHTSEIFKSTDLFFNQGIRFNDIFKFSMKIQFLLKRKGTPLYVYLSSIRFYENAYDFQAGLKLQLYETKSCRKKK
ncbi:MAG: hypothetical protein V2A54_13625 [Bacteroidota bacterium]